ncbi:ion transporter [Jannaschia rubra]|uniref:Ion transport protein n=1 Tax=Jannaschia rubra TaxID=282197 RepID=A0A0M6XR67_9RHOB|nr:ion transporter [Jannaschia rubra]CTQ32524.1 Ion transport protein [Jannaschia rubra]SFF84143.1 voltage-gated sodium channel [Jannaschia rubra]
MIPFRPRLAAFLQRPAVTRAITAVILFNAVVLGLETVPGAMRAAGPLIVALDAACLAFFVVELGAKMLAQGGRFWRDGWNLFDTVIVGLALLPGSSAFGVLRALRILRVLRIVSVFPRLRRVVEGLITALPGMASVFVLMAIIFYVGAVIATKLFGPTFPDWFGSLPLSGYTLFQIMTLESWSMGIVRPVMEVHPHAWAFFVPFILVTTFAVVNLLVGLIVNSMQDAHAEESNAATDAYRDEVLAKLAVIEQRIEKIK